MRYFSGDNEDAQEYKRWKTWTKNKIMTMDKLPKKAAGAFVYTLLTGKALECVEHLDPSKYQVENGDDIIFDLLDVRFPAKDQTDELGEMMNEVFTLRTQPGETLKGWIGRASELFDRLKRKTGVDFPQEARGWLILNRCGLSEEQRAVVLARADGMLHREQIGKALRSCFPDMVLSNNKRTSAAHLVDDAAEEFRASEADDAFLDVELLLAEHGHGDVVDPAEEFQESDIVDVLAVTWKEKRAEINRLQKARKFSQVKELKRQFRVEVEEIKRKSKCHKCHKLGHWARECPMKSSSSASQKGSGAGSGANSSKPSSGAALVQAVSEDEPSEYFVAMVSPVPSLLDQLREKVEAGKRVHVENIQVHETCLVSSPGFGVLDSGCGKTIIGEHTLSSFKQLWSQQNVPFPDEHSEENHFRYGNGHHEVSHRAINLPVYIAGRKGIIKASIVRGSAPLLISPPALRALQAQVDFHKDRLIVFKDRVVVPLRTNEAGQYVLNLMKPSSPDPTCSEVQMQPQIQQAEDCAIESSPEADQPASEESVTSEIQNEPNHVEIDVVDEQPVSATASIVLSREDWSIRSAPSEVSNSKSLWPYVFKRIVKDGATNKTLFVDQIDHKHHRIFPQRVIPSAVNQVITHFHFRVPKSLHLSADPGPWKLSDHHIRQVHAQVKACAAVQGDRSSNPLVVEVFSPPRFAPVAQAHGFSARSIDLLTGTDLSDPKARKQLKEELRLHPPELLILCPPCTDESGWIHLNSTRMDRLEYLRRKSQSRMFIRFCCELFRQQIQLGGRALFEHPTGSDMWKYPEVQALCRKFYTTKLHMCMYGMQLPHSDNFIKKSTHLLLSHEDMCSLGITCPGPSDPRHAEHDVIAGHHSKVGSISAFAGKYPSRFVKAVLETVPAFHNQEVLAIECDAVPEKAWTEVHEVAAAEDHNPQELKSVLMKLHRNLGHPPNSDLVRVLKHGQASPVVLELAKDFSCPFCESRSKPKTPMPARTDHVVGFNKQIGVDVKHLRGWKTNQKVKALNIVCHASGFQRMIPFFEVETSRLLRKLFEDHWIAWAGAPEEMLLDPAQTNMAEPMTGTAEDQGTVVRHIAAEAHWQLGKTENHGGWFNRILDKIIEQHSPKNKEEWLECVTQAHVKNSMIHIHGHTPCQYVMGRNPHIPSDLLDEPLQIVPATVSLSEQAIARAQQIRTTARMAVIELQDSRSLRKALLARPRVSRDFRPGDLVAYWRNQKWVKGELNQQGRWYGTAIVLGFVGKNLVLAHRKSILRCAPEQVRFATSEEKTLLNTPQVDLLGIKDLIEGGAFKSQQFIDLTPYSYPTQGDQSPAEDLTDSAEPDGPQPSARPVPNPPVSSAPMQVEASDSVDVPMQPQSSPPPFDKQDETSKDDSPVIDADSSSPPVEASESSYGPVRRRIHGKDGPSALWRPPALREDDFIDIMREVVPRLITDLQPKDDSNMEASASSKRPASELDSQAAEEPPAVRPRVESESEVLSVEHLSQVPSWNSAALDIDVLIADYIQKKMSKELPHSNNPPALQAKVDEGKLAEWKTLSEKPNVLRIHYGKKAKEIEQKYAHRFIGSRFVLTRKAIDEEQTVIPDQLDTFTVKGRWCLQGHLDPDLDVKALEGRLQSPTLSQMGRMLIMQILASSNWQLQLGDIKGAFLEADPLEERFRPLFAKQPPGGIPSVPPDAVIEILGNLYGQNDAPAAWFRTFDKELQALGWKASCFDSCLYTLRDSNDKLCGILGVHVDDCAVGGKGKLFEESIQALRKRFPFRKWRQGSGEFCGAFYKQKDDGTIQVSMEKFAQQIRPATIPKGAAPSTRLEPHQIKVLRAINGSLNWLSSQSRPDLAAQTSLSQQAFPNPTISHLRQANNIVRRARQHSDLMLTFQPIPLSKLTISCHSDAAFANVGNHTQAGYVIAFTDSALNHGEVCTWNPIVWKSYKLSRAVSSTMAAESQAMSVATGTVEWLSLMLAETLDGAFDVRDSREVLQRRNPIAITDCKSLYDHLISPSSPTAVEDRRTSIDITIIKESIRTCSMHIRWVPTNRMLADGLTKDAGDPIDLLRSCIRNSSYQISPESVVLEKQAEEKQNRLLRQTGSITNN